MSKSQIDRRRFVATAAALLLMMLSAGVAYGEDRSAGAGEALTGAPPSWVTEAEYRFGDSADGEVFFTGPTVQADPARGRVFAVDRPNRQVSAWTPDGTLLFRVGRKGEGPGEFIDIGSLHIETDGTFTSRRPGRLFSPLPTMVAIVRNMRKKNDARIRLFSRSTSASVPASPRVE